MVRDARSGELAGTGVVLAFGDLRLDIERRELRRGGEPVNLAPKAFDLLAFLVEQRGRVVSKDDLLQAVWGGRIVSESALTTRINAVRRALGDDGTAQRLIRTFNRKGVRFIGEVKELPDPPAPAASAPAADKPSLAVLPFENLTGDPEQEYFVDGMVEEITTAIARFPWLFVIARNSSFTYKGRAVDVKQVARELGVRYVLEGSVRKAGNRVRIAGQLIDATTGAHIWADRFDGTLDDIFDLQDQVAGGVVGAIEPQAAPRRNRRAPAASRPTSLDAYDLYLRARGAGVQTNQGGPGRVDPAGAAGPRHSIPPMPRRWWRSAAVAACSAIGTGSRTPAWRSRRGSAWRGRRSPPPGTTPGC